MTDRTLDEILAHNDHELERYDRDLFRAHDGRWMEVDDMVSIVNDERDHAVAAERERIEAERCVWPDTDSPLTGCGYRWYDDINERPTYCPDCGKRVETVPRVH